MHKRAKVTKRVQHTCWRANISVWGMRFSELLCGRLQDIKFKLLMCKRAHFPRFSPRKCFGGGGGNPQRSQQQEHQKFACSHYNYNLHFFLCSLPKSISTTSLHVYSSHLKVHEILNSAQSRKCVWSHSVCDTEPFMDCRHSTESCSHGSSLLIPGLHLLWVGREQKTALSLN